MNPSQHLNPMQFSDWLGPLGSFGDPTPAPSLPMNMGPGVSNWTAPI